MNRREFLSLSGATALYAATKPMRAAAALPTVSSETEQRSIYTLRIEPVALEIAPGHIVKTIGYNGTVPGPVLRFREDTPVTIDVHNNTAVDELVHWHGQLVSSAVDGSAEEGTPVVPAFGQRQYSFVTKPAGTRFYHTHNRAYDNFQQGTYNGQFGFFYIEPKSEPGRYDQEIFLAVHQWEPYFTNMGPPNNGLEVAYRSATLNDKALGHGDPIRVKAGARVMFRLLNASATDTISVALPGHQFLVVAMDGNPVPNPQRVPVLELGVAERIDAVVEMTTPGIWILGSTDSATRTKGLGVVVEYAGQHGAPAWSDPPKTPWDYTVFGRTSSVAEPDGRFDLTFEKIFGERVRINRWTINGKSFPDTDLLRVREGRRYRLAFRNNSGDEHPLHLHRHSFELTSIAGKPTAGVLKDVVTVPRFSSAEVDFVANNPGLTLFHCHQQLHMDYGFMVMVEYV
jgi:FtsP/CotA-like multicopper oxidase with cupredoxin domain